MLHKHTFPESDERYFRELADVQLEPVVAAAFADIRVYNELLLREYLDSVRINEIMREIDDKWRMVMRKQAIVTGYCAFPNGDQVSGIAPISRDYYEDQEVVFQGVLPVPIDQAWDDDGNEIHKYELYIQLMREGIASDEMSTRVQLTGRAKVDDIITLEFPGMMSNDRAQHWLEYYHADDVDEIDTLLLKPSNDECEMVTRLAEVVVDARAAHAGDKALITRSVEALNIYTNSLFSFDKDMPYSATVQGDGWVMNDDGKTAPGEVGEPSAMAITVSQLIWVNVCEEEKGILRPHLDARIQTPDKDIPGYHILLPLTGIKDFRSFRGMYFASHNE